MQRLWSLCGIAVVSCAAGSLITTCMSHLERVRAQGDHVFELRIYHAAPGKKAALESRFRETTSGLLSRHGLQVVGYWVSTGSEPPFDDAFIWVVEHSSREDAQKNWAALRADPDFQKLLKAEQTEKTVEKIDATYMRPTDFSPLK